MEILQQLRSAVRENGFIEVGESRDGSAAWFRKVTPDANTSVHKRLSIDSLTNSATVFWETAPTQLHSKTFRNVKSLEDWFALRPVEHAASVAIAKYPSRVD
jgi:hypothetical protein